MNAALGWFACGVLGVAIAAAAWVMVAGDRAEQRAEALVRTMLSPAELDQLNRFRYVDVPSRANPGRVFRIPAHQGLLSVIDNGSTTMRLCVRPAKDLPGREHVLAHRAYILAAEDEYILSQAKAWR